MKIQGKIFGGLGVASKTLQLQLPLLPQGIQEALSNIHVGTINVRTMSPVFIRNWTHETERIIWSGSWPSESFKFKSCIVHVNKHKYLAWVYQPLLSPHNANPWVIELISEKIPGVTEDQMVLIEFGKSKRTSCVLVE